MNRLLATIINKWTSSKICIFESLELHFKIRVAPIHAGPPVGTLNLKKHVQGGRCILRAYRVARLKTAAGLDCVALLM